ncbi:MAG: amidohydrolase family protein, partial [Rhodospirillaceae bacterium]|nr:amidohydrolase family protein [Rhodospirillaceae bacterium]
RNNIRCAAIWMEFLDHFKEVNEVVPLEGRRWIMGHLDVANEEQIKTIAELGLVMSSHTNRYIYKHGHVVRDKIGAENENDIAPLRRLVDAGVHIGFATDNVPTTLWYPVWQAVTRYNREIDAPVAPDQALTRMEALRCATIETAHLTFEEDIKGSLEPGKLADLIILSDDPLTCPENDIKGITSELTIVDGSIVHDTGVVDANG